MGTTMLVEKGMGSIRGEFEEVAKECSLDVVVNSYSHILG